MNVSFYIYLAVRANILDHSVSTKYNAVPQKQMLCKFICECSSFRSKLRYYCTENTVCGLLSLKSML